MYGLLPVVCAFGLYLWFMASISHVLGPLPLPLTPQTPHLKPHRRNAHIC